MDSQRIPTTQGDKTLGELISDLTYINYACNRGYSPNITPEQWAKVYGPRTMEMEARYQADKAITKASA